MDDTASTETTKASLPVIKTDPTANHTLHSDNVNPHLLVAPVMERSSSTSTIKFRNNYDALLKEVLEESSEDEEELLNQMDIDLTSATAELPEELRAALEDRSLADKYLANLKTFMSHRRTHSYSSMTSSKGDFSSPSTPMQTSFTQPMSPKPFFRAHQDPLSKLLDDVPYQTRLINGVESLTVLEQKFHSLRIPELDLPTVSDTVIRARLDSLYKIQDDLFIHLHGGPLAKNTHNSQNIGEKKKDKVTQLLDDIAREIGLYEEFVKKANYLCLENILNESDSSGDEYQDSEIFETDGSGIHFDSSSDISRTSPNTPASPATYSSAQAGSFTSVSASLPATSRRASANLFFSLSENRTSSSPNFRRIDSSTGESSTSHQSSDAGTPSDRSLSLSALMNDTNSPENEKNSVEPWEAFKWTPLLKISEQLYSDSVRKNSGLLTVLAVSGVIAIGTTRSLVFVYDYSQNLKCVLGDSARAVEVGSVTSLAISADHTTIACGYSQGYIIVWNIKKPAHPIRTIDPIPASQLAGALSSNATGPQQTPLRKEGHVKGAAILHIGFISIKKSEIVSADDQGMAFYHLLYKVVMVNAVDTTRILGRYQNISFSSDPSLNGGSYKQNSPPGDDLSVIPKPKKPSTVFGMQPLPLGHIPHPAESFGLVALLTPYKMIIVGLKPTPQTQFKFLKPKPLHPPGLVVDQDGLESLEAEREEPINSKAYGESLSGCLAWLPVTKTGIHNEKEPQDKKSRDSLPSTDPMLAFSWGKHLFIIRVGVEAAESKQQNGNRTGRNPIGNKTKRGNKLEFIKLGEWRCKDPIVGLQWINRQILVLFTPNEEMILFDPKNMRETERASIRNKQLVYHDWFNGPLKDLATETIVQTNQSALGTNNTIVTHKNIEMAYYHSLKGYKGKMFLLGLRQIFVGTLLSWADRILALVKAGDFLEGIELATLFYNGRRIQTVVGLPEDEQARKKLVGEELMELLVASLNYAFSSKRTYEGMTDDIAGGNSILFHDLADGCMKACLSMGKLDFLFDTVYERFAASNVRGVFLEVLEPYIVQDQMPDIPPSIMKDLVEHYSEKKLLAQLEQVIWHVNPQCLSIDQIVSMCHREGLYEAMMYVWNKSMNDYVSPVVEMLKVIRRVLTIESQTATATAEQNNIAQRSRVSSSESRVWTRPSSENNLRQNTEKLFDYLKSVLRGRSFPDQLQMVGSRATEAKSAVYSFVFSGRCVVWPRIGGKLVLTTTEEEEMSEPTYPYLRLLLRFNTKKFLEALEVVFEDPWLNGGEDILTSTFEDELPGKVISRQIIVSTLLDVMGGGLSGSGLPPPPPRPKQSISTSTVQSFSMKGSGSTTNGPGQTPDGPARYDYASSDNLVQLYMFIANNLHKYTTFILLPPKTLNKILVRLAEESNTDTREERQTAVQNLLNIYTPVNEEHMATLYEEAGFWKVLTNVYRRDKKYGKLVEAFLKDDERRHMVFDCVQALLRDFSELNTKQKNEVKSVIMIRISQFVEIDGQKTAFIIEKFFDNDHEKAIRLLEEDQELGEEEHHATADKRLFLYLRGLLEPGDGKNPVSEIIPSDTYRASGMVQQRRSSNIGPAIQERYIDLMCRFDPSGVYDYFSTKLGDNVNLDNILKSCEKYNIIDAVVWIMEKKGDTQGALDKMLEVAKENNMTILQIIKDNGAEDGRTLEGTPNANLWKFEDQLTIRNCLIGLNGVLRVGTRLCENSSRMSLSTYTTEITPGNQDNLSVSSKVDDDELDQDSFNNLEPEQDIPLLENDEVELLWFRLLDAYVEASIEIYGALGSANNSKTKVPQGLHQHIVSSLKSYVQTILASFLLSTSPQVSLPRLLLRLIRSQSRGETTFADFRDILLSMLDTYKYEGKLLEMTNQLFDRDLYGGVQEMVRKKGRGWRPRRAVCEICGAAILDISLLQRPLAWGFDDEKTDGEKEGVPEESEKDPKVTESGANESLEEDSESKKDESAVKPEPKDVVVFQCGHAYHRQCIELQLGEGHHVCTLCHNGTSKGKSQVKSKKAKGKERAAA
ncbi:Golgi CORVET complex core vacuolar protein 8-domain-containing protein [Phycomyces nitens]|nr:Golgi CORVET complex core vacuolar protein 8-domain-containing protein [Phycomyces nitens]